jgi:hypothetical protein
LIYEHLVTDSNKQSSLHRPNSKNLTTIFSQTSFQPLKTMTDPSKRDPSTRVKYFMESTRHSMDNAITIFKDGKPIDRVLSPTENQTTKASLRNSNYNKLNLHSSTRILSATGSGLLQEELAYKISKFKPGNYLT